MAEFSKFAKDILNQKYAQEGEDWEDVVDRVVDNVVADRLHLGEKESIRKAMYARKFIPGGRYLYASGRGYPQVNNCSCFDVEDSREGWGELLNDVSQTLMTGAGLGVVYSKIRSHGSSISGLGGKASGPISVMQMVNEVGRHVMQGGSRRSAIWAGLHWDHDDIFDFISAKNWSKEVRSLKKKDFNHPAPLDMTNISVIVDDSFFHAYHNPHHKQHDWAQKVYWKTIKRMRKTGEPGWSVQIGENKGECLSNACQEVRTRDDGDVCNLGSINLGRVKTKEEFEKLVRLGIGFLLCGTEYSMLPLEKMHRIREKNRRLGLGLMGVHEWLLKRDKDYGPDPDLEEWLQIYKNQANKASIEFADRLDCNVPIKNRAIAPTGSISIIGETTSGIEPIFCVAFKRRYLKDGDKWMAQYVIDSTAERLIQKGVDPDDIEDAYELAQDVERRVEFQAFVAQYVDQGISSTINLPRWDTKYNNETNLESFGNMLMKYLPKVRGITTYPESARGGQPLTPVSYEDAKGKTGVEFEEFGNENSCPGGSCEF